MRWLESWSINVNRTSPFHSKHFTVTRVRVFEMASSVALYVPIEIFDEGSYYKHLIYPE